MLNVSLLYQTVAVPLCLVKHRKVYRNKPSVFLEKRQMGQNRNIIVRVIGDIGTSPLGVVLPKIIGSMKITTLILHSAPTSHGQALMESMKLSTLTVLFTLYYCYFPINVDIEKINNIENSEHIL